MRLRAVLLVLLLVPLSVPGAAAQQPDAFDVVTVTREGDTLRFELRPNEDMRSVNVTFFQNGAVVALPAYSADRWDAGETRAVAMDLIKDVDRGTVRFRYVGGLGTYLEYTRDVHVPANPDAAPVTGGGTGARVFVEDVRRAQERLSVDLVNVGDAGTGLLVVSIEDPAQRKIAAPYYRSLRNLGAGGSQTLLFDVPDTLGDAVVALEYANRTERVHVVVRAAHATEDGEGDAANVTLATELPFREADIGRTIDFPLTLRNEGSLALVQLSAEGLPAGYSARFFVGGSAVPSLYLDRNQTRQVTLSVTLPNDEAEVDRTVEFTTLARGNATLLAQLPMGLAVRGIGKLVLIPGAEGLPDIPAGGTARTTLSVRNSGSAPLFDVELDSRRAYGWVVRFEPSRIDRLDPGESRTVSVELRAPDVLAGGQYSTDVAARSGEHASSWEALAVTVDAPEKGGGGWLWLLFGGLMVGTIGFGMWRKRLG